MLAANEALIHRSMAMARTIMIPPPERTDQLSKSNQFGISG